MSILFYKESLLPTISMAFRFLVAACAKHYVGDGGTTRGINENFTGSFTSDWHGVDMISSPPHTNYTSSVRAAVQAGIDMVMVPFNFTEFANDLMSLVINKVIPVTRIDDAVRRILLVKFTDALFGTLVENFLLHGLETLFAYGSGLETESVGSIVARSTAASATSTKPCLNTVLVSATNCLLLCPSLSRVLRR